MQQSISLEQEVVLTLQEEGICLFVSTLFLLFKRNRAPQEFSAQVYLHCTLPESHSHCPLRPLICGPVRPPTPSPRLAPSRHTTESPNSSVRLTTSSESHGFLLRSRDSIHFLKPPQ